MPGETNKVTTKAGAKARTKAVTPPKGRPTPTRKAPRRRRVFGSTFQWAALAVLGILLFVLAVMLLGGGDFNPFNDDTTAPAVQLGRLLGGGGWPPGV